MNTSKSAGGQFTVDAEGNTCWKGGQGGAKSRSGGIDRQAVMAGLSSAGEYTGELSRADPVP